MYFFKWTKLKWIKKFKKIWKAQLVAGWKDPEWQKETFISDDIKQNKKIATKYLRAFGIKLNKCKINF